MKKVSLVYTINLQYVRFDNNTEQHYLPIKLCLYILNYLIYIASVILSYEPLIINNKNNNLVTSILLYLYRKYFKNNFTTL